MYRMRFVYLGSEQKKPDLADTAISRENEGPVRKDTLPLIQLNLDFPTVLSTDVGSQLTWEGIAEDHNFSITQGALRNNLNQLEAANLGLRHEGDVLFQADPGEGKTPVGLSRLEKHLRQGKKVIYLASGELPMDQFIAGRKKAFDSDDSIIAKISGQITPLRREAIYNDSTKRLFFCTAEALIRDIELKRVDLSEFSGAVIDESHRGRREHAVARCKRAFKDGTAS